MSEYAQLVKQLLLVNNTGGVKLGLCNCQRLNQALGCPAQTFPSIHVAGTNGKGSVVAKIAAALQSTGLKVGVYTSPHIACFRERIQINGQMISETDVQRLLTKLFALADQQEIPATFFEFTTLMAFKYFAESGVDMAVIETGLGGRLDATNIIHPKLSVITSISLDHTELLGDTVAAIAQEKAGIIKPATPVVIGPRVPLSVMQAHAHLLGSPVHVVSGEYATFNQENSAIAAAALQLLGVSPAAIEQGIEARPRCRFEVLPHSQLAVSLHWQAVPEAVVMDVAHNPDALRLLLSEARLRFPGRALRLVLGLSKSKDMPACLGILKEQVSHFHLVESANQRAAPVVWLKNQLVELSVSEQLISPEVSVKAAVNAACRQAAQNGEVVLICGTFFIMAEARAALRIEEARDAFDLN